MSVPEPPHTGRGGWSWYTGSAGWAYRLIIETLLGIQRHGDSITIHPLLPRDWPYVSMVYRHSSSDYQINAQRGEGEYQVMLDGVSQPGNIIPLMDDGQRHVVEINLGTEI